MRIDFGLVLAIVLEYIFFIYYADTLFDKKKNKYLCYAIIALGYVIHMVVCMFGNVVINTVTAFILEFLSFYICYHITIKNALFQSLILVAMCLASEYLVIFIPYIGIIPTETISMSPEQSLVLTIISRILYLIGIMIASRIFNRKEQVSPSVGLIIIPVLTIFVVMLLMNTSITSNYLSISCLFIMIINVIVFVINQKMTIQKLEISALKKQELKEKIDFEEYNLLKEEYQRISILRHDFKEIIQGLSALIDTDNKEAQQYIKHYNEMVDMSKLTEYSDNKMLNVLLSRNKTECDKKGIQLVVDPIQAHLSFIKDTDTVIIFSNLLNNAIESCLKSKEKKIFLSISTVNENFIVINVENSCDNKPIVIESALKTHKNNSKFHGLGMNSIKRVIQEYSGNLKWEYNENERYFLTTIIMKNNMNITV